MLENNNYFNKRRMDAITSMTKDDMWKTLSGLEKSVYWNALLKYMFERSQMVEGSLKTADPVTQLVAICRNQGILLGFSDIIEAIIKIKEANE
jgi:hypothetical protein